MDYDIYPYMSFQKNKANSKSNAGLAGIGFYRMGGA